jgi:hypothetical protein
MVARGNAPGFVVNDSIALKARFICFMSRLIRAYSVEIVVKLFFPGRCPRLAMTSRRLR